jgi:Uma2 family endonuclease
MGSTQAITFVSESSVSQEEFARWVAERPAGDLNRYELLEGRIVMNPPAGWPEGEGELSVASILRVYVLSRNLGRVFGPSQGFEMPTGDTVAPDAAYISQQRWEAGPRPEPGKFLRIVPDLTVEVLSPNNPARDRVQKRALYAQAGIREYWIVDLRRREVTLFYSLVEGRFEAGQTLTEEQTLRSKVLPGLEIPVQDLLISP